MSDEKRERTETDWKIVGLRRSITRFQRRHEETEIEHIHEVADFLKDLCDILTPPEGAELYE